MGSPLRVALVDIARTVALLAMVVFHFTYDLELFGFAERGTMMRTEWVLFAQGIAGSFIFLSGISLVLASQNGPIARSAYLKRLSMIGIAAAAVTAGTYVAMGSAFVRFGILHLLFSASVLGLLALYRPFWITGFIGAAIVALPHMSNWPLLNDAAWLWLGKTIAPQPAMVDYVPILPWFGVFLLGMSLAQFIANLGRWSSIASLLDPSAPLVRVFSWPGKHSLSIYLIHQPVLFGLVYLAKIATN